MNETKPTADAMRAARKRFPGLAAMADATPCGECADLLSIHARELDEQTGLPELLAALTSALRYIEVQVAYQGAMTADQVEARIKEEYFPAQVAIGANSCNTLARFDIRGTRDLLAKHRSP